MPYGYGLDEVLDVQERGRCGKFVEDRVGVGEQMGADAAALPVSQAVDARRNFHRLLLRMLLKPWTRKVITW